MASGSQPRRFSTSNSKCGRRDDAAVNLLPITDFGNRRRLQIQFWVAALAVRTSKKQPDRISIDKEAQ